jgi:hypothetical protein
VAFDGSPFAMEQHGRERLRRMKQREDENRKFKQLVADMSLDVRFLKGMPASKL